MHAFIQNNLATIAGFSQLTDSSLQEFYTVWILRTDFRTGFVAVVGQDVNDMPFLPDY